MDYTDYLIWKLVGLGILVFVVKFVYALVTGGTIEDCGQE